EGRRPPRREARERAQAGREEEQDREPPDSRLPGRDRQRPGRLVRRQLQGKDRPADVPDEQDQGVPGSRERRERRERVLELVDARPRAVDRAAEDPRPQRQDAGERRGRSDVERPAFPDRGGGAPPEPAFGAGRERQKREGRRGRGALFGEDAQAVAGERGDEREAGPPSLGDPKRRPEIQQEEDRGERLPAPDEARHGLDVDRMDGEEERGRERQRRRHREPQQEPPEEERRRGVQKDVAEVKEGGAASVDPPLEGEG